MCYRRYLGILTNDLNFVDFHKKYKSLFYFSVTPLVDRCCFSHSEPFNAFILLRGGLDWKIITQWVKFSPWLHLCTPGVKSWKQREFFTVCIYLHKTRRFFWAETKSVLTLWMKSSLSWFLKILFHFCGLRNIFFFLEKRESFAHSVKPGVFQVWTREQWSGLCWAPHSFTCNPGSFGYLNSMSFIWWPKEDSHEWVMAFCFPLLVTVRFWDGTKCLVGEPVVLWARRWDV